VGAEIVVVDRGEERRHPRLFRRHSLLACVHRKKSKWSDLQAARKRVNATLEVGAGLWQPGLGNPPSYTILIRSPDAVLIPEHLRLHLHLLIWTLRPYRIPIRLAVLA
jgi:hypothetical protein